MYVSVNNKHEQLVGLMCSLAETKHVGMWGLDPAIIKLLCSCPERTPSSTNILPCRWCLSEHSHTQFVSDNAGESVEKWPHLPLLGGESDPRLLFIRLPWGHYQAHAQDVPESTSFKNLTEWGQLAFKMSKRTRHTKQPTRTMCSFLPMTPPEAALCFTLS